MKAPPIRFAALAVAVAAAMLLAACGGGDDPTSTAAAAATPTSPPARDATATPTSPLAQGGATATPTVTPTPTQPAPAGPTVTPTGTSTAVPTATPTAPPTATPTQGPITVSIVSSKDTTIYQNIDGRIANGSGQHMFAGKTNSDLLRRALVAFDVAGSIPAGAEVLSAELTLNMSRTRGGPAIITVHQMPVDWGEGTSDAAGEEGRGAGPRDNDATWIHSFFDSQNWTQAGGYFTAAESASLLVSDVGSYTWASNQDMVRNVARWLEFPAGASVGC